MSHSNNAAGFDVTAHHDMPERGASLLGHFRGAGFMPGQRVRSLTDVDCVFIVAGVESLSGAGGHLSAVVFRDRPGSAEVIRAFPIGSTIFPEPGLSGVRPD
jgi:hypothetical protein